MVILIPSKFGLVLLCNITTSFFEVGQNRILTCSFFHKNYFLMFFFAFFDTIWTVYSAENIVKMKVSSQKYFSAERWGISTYVYRYIKFSMLLFLLIHFSGHYKQSYIMLFIHILYLYCLISCYLCGLPSRCSSDTSSCYFPSNYSLIRLF